MGDLRYALRSLWSDRAFAATAILSLAVGIGANTAIFSLVNGILLRPLTYPEPQRLVALSGTSPLFAGATELPISIGQLVEWRRRTHSFDDIAAYQVAAANLTGEGRPQLLAGARVSANFLRTLGIGPRLGRDFAAEEEVRGRHRVVILTDACWRRRFGADPGVVGRAVALQAVPYVVVGILPPAFQFPRSTDVGHRLNAAVEFLRPLGYEPDEAVPHAGDLNYQSIARLRAGVTAAQAQADLAVVEAAIDRAIGHSWQILPAVQPLLLHMVSSVRQSLIVLFGAVGAVLLVLCVNLANLSLLRAARRVRDLAIRTALGATRAQVAAQALIESAVVAIAGGGLGMAVAYVGTRWLVAAAPVDLPRLASVHVDPYVLLFALVLSLGTGFVCSFLPAWRAASTANPYDALRPGGRSSEGRGGIRLRSWLVGCEVGLCAALLVTAGLFIASFVRLTHIERGFEVERVLAAAVNLPAAKYAQPAQLAQFYSRVLDEARALPGVESAAVVSYLPLQGESWIDIVRPDNDTRPENQLPAVNLRFVSAGYFKTLGIPLDAGSDFSPSDRRAGLAIVSASLAHKLWPRTAALGRKLMDGDTHLEVCAVAADTRSTSLETAPVDMLYIPMWQRPTHSAAVMVRTALPAAAVAEPLRQAIWHVDADVVPEEHTLVQLMSESIARRRFQAVLVFLFAAAALGLAAFGTYGVVSYAVARRRAEMGIRMALGAGRREVLAMVVRQGMTPVLAGLAGGMVAALWIGEAVASLLFQVSPHDGRAFGLSVAVLLAVSAFACWLPARRATRVNPVEALRYE